MDGALMDSAGSRLTDLREAGRYHVVMIFLIFMLLSAMTMMNMLIGVLCEVVSAVAADEKEEAAVKLMKSTILVMLKNLDVDGNGVVDEEEIMEVCNDPDALDVLNALQID